MPPPGLPKKLDRDFRGVLGEGECVAIRIRDTTDDFLVGNESHAIVTPMIPLQVHADGLEGIEERLDRLLHFENTVKRSRLGQIQGNAAKHVLAKDRLVEVPADGLLADRDGVEKAFQQWVLKVLAREQVEGFESRMVGVELIDERY